MDKMGACALSCLQASSLVFCCGAGCNVRSELFCVSDIRTDEEGRAGTVCLMEVVWGCLEI